MEIHLNLFFWHSSYIFIGCTIVRNNFPWRIRLSYFCWKSWSGSITSFSRSIRGCTFFLPKVLQFLLLSYCLENEGYITGPTIIHRASEINSSFHVKLRTAGKVQLLFFRRFLLVAAEYSFRGEDSALGNNSVTF